eukprot:403340228
MENQKQHLLDIIEDTEEDKLEDKEFGIYDTFDQSDCLDVGCGDEVVNKNQVLKYSNITTMKAQNCNKLFEKPKYDVQNQTQMVQQSKSLNDLQNIVSLKNQQNQNWTQNQNSFQSFNLLQDHKMSLAGLKQLAKIGSLKNTYKSYNSKLTFDSKLKDKENITQNVSSQGLESYLNSFIHHQENDHKNENMKNGKVLVSSKAHFRTGSMTTFHNSPKLKDYQRDRKSQYKLTYAERLSSLDNQNTSNIRHSVQSQQELTQRLLSHKEKVKQKISLLPKQQQKSINNSGLNFSTLNHQNNINLPNQSSSINQSISIDKSNVTRRSPKQFYQDQVNYQENSFRKLLFKFQEQLIQEQEEQVNVQLVCKGSARIMAQKRACSSMQMSVVYDRLYNDHDKEKSQDREQQISPECTFKPQILSNMGLFDREDRKVEDILYSDAIRRQKARQLSVEARDSEFQDQKQIPGNIVLPKSEKYLEQPLERDFKATIYSIFGQINNIELIHFDYRQVEEIMVELGFIQDNSDRIELFKIWELLGFKEKKQGQTVYSDKLLNLLFNILNVKGTTDYKECRKIHYKFQKLFQNRMNFLKEQKPLLEKQECQKFKFYPHINQRSREIDDSLNQSLNQNKSRQDILLDKGKQYQQRKNDISEERISLEMKLCTFKPQTNLNTLRVNNVSINENKKFKKDIALNNSKLSSANDSVIQLMKPLIINKVSNDQVLKSIQNIFDVQKQTKLNESKIKKQFVPQQPKRKDISNKENTNMFNVLDRAKYSKSSLSNYTSQNVLRNCTSELDSTPLVYLDIHINKDQMDRITLYKGQNPDDAIQRFAMKNYLTNSDILIIKNALKSQNNLDVDGLLRNPKDSTKDFSNIQDNKMGGDSKEHSMRFDSHRPKPLNISQRRSERYQTKNSDAPNSSSSPVKSGKSPDIHKKNKGILTSSQMNQKKRTIASIVGNGLNQKMDEQLEDAEGDKEYIPTMKEKFLKSQQIIPKFMLKHNNRFRMNWDLFVMLLAVYNCLSIPFTVAFEPDQTTAFSAWERIIDVCFGLDILVNFRTTFVNEKTGFEICDNKSVFLNYIKSGRFFIDLAASIPFELIIESVDSGASNKQLRLFGLLKLVRLLRLGRIIRFMKFKQGFKMGMRLIQLLLGLLLLVHWIACIWYLIIRNISDWIPPKDLALSNPGDDISSFTGFYMLDLMSRYFVVYYYAVLTMAGNDILPMNTVQTISASVIIITGAIVSAFIFGNMAAIMASLNKKSNQFDEQMDLVNTTMRQMRLPPEMQDRVLSFMMHVQNSPDLHQDIEKFFLILNEPLRKQVLHHLHGPLVRKIQIMKKCSSVEQSFFICNLKPVLFLPNDVIAREGEKGDNIYFLNKGEVQVILKTEKNGLSVDEIFKLLKEGQFFGEVALLTKLKRTSTIKSSDFTNCAYMTKDDLQIMEEHYPHIVHQFRLKIKEYADPKMYFRRLMIKNLHYMRNLSDEIINEIICCLQVKRFAKGQNIIKCGDVSNRIHFLREGEIEIVVSEKIGASVKEEDERIFDRLNTGSAFCAYTFISDEAQQLQTFRASKHTDCILESISREDIFRLSKKYYQLADQLDMIREKFDENETDFDFFRFRAPRKEFSDQLKNLIRKKFRVALCKFYKKYRDGLQDIPEALQIIKKVQQARAQKVEEINKLRTQSLGINYGGGYGEMHKFHFSQMSGSILNPLRSEAISSKQNDTLKSQSKLLAQSVLLTQENLKKQNQQLLDIIEEFNDKYVLLKDKFNSLENELTVDDVDEQLQTLRNRAKPLASIGSQSEEDMNEE